jgi:ferric-dicitrate binding protein FerR (iron transport regulator)
VIDSDRLDRLLDGYFGQVLTEPETRELEQILRSDAEARASYWRAADLHTRLREALTEERGMISARREVARSSAKVRRPSRSQRQRTWRSRSLVNAGIGTALAAMIILGVLIWNIAESGRGVFARVDHVIGAVSLTNADGNAQVREGALFRDGSLVVGEGASCRLRYDDGTTITLREGRCRSVPNSSRKKHLALESGTLTATVAKQAAGKPFTITTPHAEAKVLGTRLKIVVSTVAAKLEVTVGSVAFMRPDHASVTVAAGEFAVAQNGVELVASRLSAFAFDFEDGLPPTVLRDGTVVAGPPRPGNRFCVQGQAKRHGDSFKSEVCFERLDEFFIYATGMRVTFDCWLNGGNGPLGACVWGLEMGKTFSISIPPVPQGAWTRVTLNLDDFFVTEEPSIKLRPGDTILNFLVASFGAPDDCLYIDNLTISE